DADERLGGIAEERHRIRGGLETVPDPLWISRIRDGGGVDLFEILRVGRETLPDPLWKIRTGMPRGVAADAEDAELGGEAQVFRELILHVDRAPTLRSAISFSTRLRISTAT